MNSTSDSLLVNKPVKYTTLLQIVTDLNLSLQEVEALTEILHTIWEFTFVQEPSLILSDKFNIEDEGEHMINWITFYFLKPKNVSSRS